MTIGIIKVLAAASMELDKKLLLQRIDYSCRLAVKPTA